MLTSLKQKRQATESSCLDLRQLGYPFLCGMWRLALSTEGLDPLALRRRVSPTLLPPNGLADPACGGAYRIISECLNCQIADIPANKKAKFPHLTIVGNLAIHTRHFRQLGCPVSAWTL